MLCSNFVKFGRREISRVVCYLPDKNKISSPRIAPKICQGQPQTMYSECSGFHPDRFTFGAVTPERVNTIKTDRKVFPVFGWSLVLSRTTRLFWWRVKTIVFFVIYVKPIPLKLIKIKNIATAQSKHWTTHMYMYEHLSQRTSIASI